MSLTEYQDKLKRLVVNKVGGHPSPHKLCMLLAVLDLARAGALTRNEIRFEPPLLERYDRLFSAVRRAGDHPNPHFPFFHLSGKLRGGGSSFWHLRPLPGREISLTALGSARSATDISGNVAFAEVDPELFELLQQPQCVEALAETIATHWLDRGLQDLREVAAANSDISRYERRLRLDPGPLATENPPPAYVRDPAFRRVVTEAYDYRCVATGLRVVLPNGEAMVEAAHIHPFSQGADDDPRNGLALCPNMHWAMDKLLIAPGPDLKWHVSPYLDDRIPDFEMLFSLSGRPLILPVERRFSPKRESLEWRLENLRRPSDELFVSAD
ncbi:MAG: HNH endonuclease [Telluria sp.]|nr:HNH endonuclease [Telluria sp.]